MKKFLLISFILSAIFFSKPLFASHYAGAELTYVSLGGIVYQVTLTFYKDCSGIPEPPNTNIFFVCSSNSLYNFNTNLAKISNTGQEITSTCSQAASSCSFNGGNSNSGHPLGIKEIVYQANVTLPPCSSWEMSWSGSARNPISTLASTGNWYIASKTNNVAALVNNAPIYNNKLLPICYVNQLTTLDYGGIDPDGDSLSYALYAPYTAPYTSVVYQFGYDENNFLDSSTPITLDPVTGILSFTPTSTLSTVIGIKVTQWRDINGVMTNIGTTLRDLSLKVITSTNSPPTISGIDTTNSHNYNITDTIYEQNASVNQAIEFDINGYDADIFNSANTGNPENFNISWTGGISGATFTTYYNGTDSAYAHFSWMPTSNDLGSSYSFDVIIQDFSCPYFAETNKSFTLNILADYVSLNTNNTTICSDDSIILIVTNYNDNASFVWKINNNIINTGPNPKKFVYNASNYSPGIDTVTIEIYDINQNFINSDTAIIKIIHQPQVNFADTGFCPNASIILDAGFANLHIWKNQMGNIIGTNQTLEISQIGTYSIYVNGEQNSICFDNDTFNVSVSSLPQIDIGPDHNMELYDSVTLDAGHAGYSYLWSTGQTTQAIIIHGYDLGVGNSIVWLDATNGFCTLRDSVEFYVIVGIEQISPSATFTIAPIPNNGIFAVGIKDIEPQTLNIEIYNYSGTKIETRSIKANENDIISFDLSSHAKGAYFIIINSDKGIIWHSKFITQ